MQLDSELLTPGEALDGPLQIDVDAGVPGRCVRQVSSVMGRSDGRVQSANSAASTVAATVSMLYVRPGPVQRLAPAIRFRVRFPVSRAVRRWIERARQTDR